MTGDLHGGLKGSGRSLSGSGSLTGSRSSIARGSSDSSLRPRSSGLSREGSRVTDSVPTAFLSPRARVPGRSRKASLSPRRRGATVDAGLALDFANLGRPMSHCSARSDADEVMSIPGTPTGKESSPYTLKSNRSHRSTGRSGTNMDVIMELDESRGLDSSKKYRSMDFALDSLISPERQMGSRHRSTAALLDKHTSVSPRQAELSRSGSSSRTQELREDGRRSPGRGRSTTIDTSVLSATRGGRVMNRPRNQTIMNLTGDVPTARARPVDENPDLSATMPTRSPDASNGELGKRTSLPIAIVLNDSVLSPVSSGSGFLASTNSEPVRHQLPTSTSVPDMADTPTHRRRFSADLAPVQEYDDIPSLDTSPRSSSMPSERTPQRGRPGQSYPTPVGALSHDPTGFTIPKVSRGEDARALEDSTPAKLRAKMHKAALKSNKNAILKCLSKGASIDCRDSYLNTPLLLAARDGNADIFKMLLDLGANPLAVNRPGYTLGHWAALNGHPEIINIGIRYGFIADITNNYGNTPLLLAAWHNRPGVVRSLLSHGAKIDVVNSDNNTPLHMAAEQGHADITKMLLDHGADATIPNNKNLLPEEVATKSCRLLIKASSHES